MRKIFIDGGANKGQSTRAFLKQWPKSKEFEIYMFEGKAPSTALMGMFRKFSRFIKIISI